MNWQKLISAKRFECPEGSLETHSLRSPYLIDVDRITYSSHFRKLQDKTQVHPLSKSDYVRTRLTHSLEVAIVGRSLGFAIGEHIIKKHNLKNITEHDFGYILQATCLAHDIGNPPFGHLGEEAIQHFFIDNETKLLEHISQEEYDSLKSFDGNSQGFRIITNLAGWQEKGGLRLTFATLGTFCKYPNITLNDENIKDITKKYNNKQLISTKKCGILLTEKYRFLELTKGVDLINLSDLAISYYRHPLTFLLEAADDICYAIADIEDAFFVGLTDLKQVEKLLAPIARNPKKYGTDNRKRIKELKETSFYKEMDSRKKVEWLRGKAISNLILEAQRVFVENEEEILKGNFNQELLALSSYAEEIKACKRFAKESIFNSHDKINSEIIGIEAITSVLEELYKVILNPNHPKSKRILSLLKGKINPNEDTIYQSLVKVVDLISDFTDRNILDFLKVLKGV